MPNNVIIERPCKVSRRLKLFIKWQILMKRTMRALGVGILAVALAGCVTDKQYNMAILKVESAWKEINDRTLKIQGTRSFRATKQQGFTAAQLTTSRLGMVVEKESFETGFLFVTAPAPVPLTMAEWKTVQESDTPDLRSLLDEDFGVLKWWVTLDPSAKDVLANIFINEKGADIEVSLGLRLRNRGPESDRVRRLQPPPTAVRLGVKKFWSAYEKEINAIISPETSTETTPATPPEVGSVAAVAKSAPPGVKPSSANPDAVALIIGNKNYSDRLPHVDFAHNDAEAMKRFVAKTLGFSESNIIDLRDATLADMEAVLGNDRSHKGKLWRWVRPRESDVFVFYSGHGVPGLKDGRKYLLPVDGDPDTPEIRGYPTELLYENLTKLEARSVTVLLDACFSGESPGGTLVRAASGIRVAPKKMADYPLTIISAADSDQVASWDQEAQHGLFTRHLLDALSGAADDKRYGNADGRITLGEVKLYMDREMTYAARRHFGREQRVAVIGNPEQVIVTLGK